MLGIVVIFVVLAVTLGLFFWLGSLFLQSYIYTQPSEQLAWQGPVAGVAIAAYLSLWCLLIVRSEGASPTNLPYDTIFRFSPKVDMVAEPVPELWVLKHNGSRVLYKRKRLDQIRYTYEEANLARRGWDHNAKAIEMEVDGQRYLFTREKQADATYVRFVADRGGWYLTEFEGGPNGIPERFLTGRFIANMALNFFHLALWFALFWVVLRYLPSHALGLAFVFWLLATLIVLPVILSQAGNMAISRQQTRPAQSHNAAPDLVDVSPNAA